MKAVRTIAKTFKSRSTREDAGVHPMRVFGFDADRRQRGRAFPADFRHADQGARCLVRPDRDEHRGRTGNGLCGVPGGDVYQAPTEIDL